MQTFKKGNITQRIPKGLGLEKKFEEQGWEEVVAKEQPKPKVQPKTKAEAPKQ